MKIKDLSRFKKNFTVVDQEKVKEKKYLTLHDSEEKSFSLVTMFREVSGSMESKN